MTAAKVMDAIARLPDCDGQSSRRRVSIHSWKNGGRSKIAQNSKVRVSPNSWANIEDPVVLLGRKFVRTSTCYLLAGKTIWESSNGTLMGKVPPHWECLFVYRKQATFTNLDVSQEKRIDDCWTVDDPWKGFTKSTPLKEKPPKGKMWSGERLTKDSHDYQTRSCMARSMDEHGYNR